MLLYLKIGMKVEKRNISTFKLNYTRLWISWGLLFN